ncbi:hypothetical protein CerSpe_100470 [Prunus speciosa]
MSAATLDAVSVVHTYLYSGPTFFTIPVSLHPVEIVYSQEPESDYGGSNSNCGADSYGGSWRYTCFCLQRGGDRKCKPQNEWTKLGEIMARKAAALQAKAGFIHIDGDHLTLLNVYHAYK